MLEIIRRETLFLINERRMILIALLTASSAYILLFGNLYKERLVQNIPVAVCDLDGSALSREFTRTIADTAQFSFVGYLSSEVEAVKLLERGDVAIVVVIPENFSQNFYTQQPTEIAILQDGTNIAQLNYSQSPINHIVGNFTVQYNQQAAVANSTAGISSAPMSTSSRTIGNSVQGYLEFYTYGIVLTVAHAGIMMAFGMSVFEDKKNSALFKKFGAVKLILTKEIFYLVLSLSSVAIAITMLVVCFDVVFRAEIWQMFLISSALLFVAENLAGLLGNFFKKFFSLAQCVLFYSLPAVLTVGYVWPEHGMPPTMRFLAAIQPMHYALSDFRRLALTGIDKIYWQHVGILLAFGICFMILFFAQSKKILNSDDNSELVPKTCDDQPQT